MPIGTKFRAKFSQYDILVTYKRLLTENNVPVGFWHNLIRNVFFCKLRHIGPFRQCCRVDMLQPWTRRLLKLHSSLPKLPWIVLWKKLGLALLIVLLPTPYYVRLFIYYHFESTEVRFFSHFAEMSSRLAVKIATASWADLQSVHGLRCYGNIART